MGTNTLQSLTQILTCLCLIWIPNTWTAQAVNEVVPPKKVGVILDPPFVMHDRTSGQWSGLLVDVLEAAHIHLQEVETVVETEYGQLLPSGDWSGLLGKTARQEYDLAVAPFSIRAKQSKAVTFTQPVIHAGYRILHTTQTLGFDTPTDYLGTLVRPFTGGLWCLVLAMSLLASLFLGLVVRFSPQDASRNQTGEATSMGWAESFRFTFGAFLGQEGAPVPRSVAGRVVCAVWRLFSALTAAAYLAALVLVLFRDKSMLAAAGRLHPLQLAEEMVRKQEVSILGIKQSNTYNYISNHTGFWESKIYSMWKDNWDQLMVDSLDEALQMMREGSGKYAVFMDEATADYLASQEPCHLVVVGDPVGDRTFGLACSRASAYLCDHLNQVILHLQETGQMEKLREKWFWGGCHKNNQDDDGGDSLLDTFDLLTPGVMSIRRFAAAFILLACGWLAALTVLVVERRWPRVKMADGYNVALTARGGDSC